MTRLSIDTLYILATWCRWDGISGDTDNIYTDKEKAEKDCEERNSFPGLVGSGIKYQVITLSDYIDDVKANARDAGRADERDSHDER